MFTTWPDFGVPELTSGVLTLLHHVRTTCKSCDRKAPIVVHCRWEWKCIQACIIVFTKGCSQMPVYTLHVHAVAYLRDVTFIILELLPSIPFHGNILPFHFIQRWCGEVWDFHYTGPNPWPSGCWRGELTDWCEGCGQEYAKPENADGASCCKWQIQPHTTVAVSPRYTPHLHAEVACGSLQYWACYCHLLIQLQFLRLLMCSTDKRFLSKTQLNDKSTAGRFDPKVS